MIVKILMGYNVYTCTLCVHVCVCVRLLEITGKATEFDINKFEVHCHKINIESW